MLLKCEVDLDEVGPSRMNFVLRKPILMKLIFMKLDLDDKVDLDEVGVEEVDLDDEDDLDELGVEEVGLEVVGHLVMMVVVLIISRWW